MKDKLIIELFNKNCIKFGDFKLKDGSKSNIYIDLKNIISYPYILNIILDELYNKIKTLEYNRLIGVPYGGLVISSGMASKFNIPMLLIRKEIKKYGLKKAIEGEYSENDKCLVIEDTITTGSSAIQFIEMIQKYKLLVHDVLVICDRRIEQKYNFKNINIHSIFTLNDIIEVLYSNKYIKMDIYSNIKQKIDKINYDDYSPNFDNTNIIKIIDSIKNNKTKYCFDTKFESITQIIELINFYKTHICILKIYSNIINNYTVNDGLKLKALAQKYNFLIMDGTMFSYNNDLFITEYTKNKIYSWVDLITLSNMHDDTIYKIVDEINNKLTFNVSVIYTNYDSKNNILNTINTHKNIIGLYNYNIDCNILIFDDLKTKNNNANIIILDYKDYTINKKFIYFDNMRL